MSGRETKHERIEFTDPRAPDLERELLAERAREYEVDGWIYAGHTGRWPLTSRNVAISLRFCRPVCHSG